MSQKKPLNIRDWTVYSIAAIVVGTLLASISLAGYDSELDGGTPVFFALLGSAIATAGGFALLVPIVAKGVLLGNQVFADSEERRSRHHEA